MQSKDSHDFLPFRRQAGDTRTTSLTQAAVAGGAFPAIEAVLLDFHGVLYEDSAWRHWFSNLLRQVGVSTTCDALATFHCDYLHEDNDCEANYWRSMRRFLAAIGLTRCLTDEVIAAGKAKRRKLSANARALPCVTSTLKRLAASLFPLGVACSRASSPEVVCNRVRDLGLHDWFRVITCLPIAPPQALAFPQLKAVASDLNTRIDRTAFISASPLALLDARAQGMYTIAFNAPARAVADCHLQQFQQLTEILSLEHPRLLAG